ncbi:MAG: hypothetical protein JXA20_02970 [Spirochaetes bacterium]|nr:hypothetical protein [Spirochaetota bacterium]
MTDSIQQRIIECCTPVSEGRSVAIVRAASIITGTMEGILSSLGNPRTAVILGPSTFMRPEVFTGTPVIYSPVRGIVMLRESKGLLLRGAER